VHSPSEEYGECVDEDMNFMTKRRCGKIGRMSTRSRRGLKVWNGFGRLDNSRESSLIYTVLNPETEQKAQAVGIGPGPQAGRKGWVRLVMSVKLRLVSGLT